MDALQRMEKALGAASDAGDVEAAREIAAEMRRMLKEVNPAVDAPVDFAADGAKQAAAETGAGEAMLVGAGRKMSRVAEGVGDLATGNQPSDETRQRRANEDRSFFALRSQRPFATIGGEALPYAATVGMSIPAAMTTSALVEAAEPGTTQERIGRGAAGAVATGAGGLLAKGVASFLTPVTPKAAGPANQGALRAAERIGVEPRLSEVTGSNFLRRLEDTVAQLPGGGGVMAEHGARNAVAINQAAARAIGETADEITPAVFARAAQRLGKVFEDIKSLPGKVIQITPDVASAADDILRVQGKMLPHQQDANLINLAKQAKALAMNRGRIDGETYQLIRSGLSDAAFDATVGSNKQLYGRLLEAVDNAAEASLQAGGQGALAEALRTARPQYANLKILEKGLTTEAGNVSPARVASTMRTNNPGAFRRGQFVGKEMGDIATVGEGLKPLREGSQTFSRSEMGNPLSALLNAAWSYPVAKAVTSPVVSMYPRALGRMGITSNAGKYLEAPGRAAVAAALQEGSLLPLVPASHQ